VTHGFTHLGDEVVHEGYIWHVAVAQFSGPDGQRFVRDVVRSPGAVGVVALDGSGPDVIVTLVRQYRAALDAELLEIPAGMRDVPGEPPELTASRELAEEVGLVAGSLELLTVVHPSAGMTDATTHLYLATQLTAVPRQTHGPEEDAMTVVHLPLSEALAKVRSGEITDGKTVIALLLTALR
jgi:ADP-ribose pyrophosphatase